MQNGERLHALDTVRAFALLLGVAFHAAISFVPGMIVGIWAIVDRTPSVVLSDAAFVSHIFRMSLFFFIAGFFARMLYQRGGARGFWSNRLKRILVPLIAGWIVVFPAIAWVWTVGIKKTYGDAAPPFTMSLPEVPLGFPLTHLWFLYYLLVLYVAILAVRAVFVRLDKAGKLRAAIDSVARWCMSGYVANFLLGLPLAACLLALPFWVYWQGIPTPDHSLLPQLPSFVGFSTAMIVGWIVHRSTSLLGEMQRRYVGHLALAVVASAVCVWIMHSQAPLTPVAPGTYRTVFTISFGIALWSWVFGLVGAALRFFSDFSAARRYMADASYWIYIMHLPVVAAFQVAVSQWPLHWTIKYTFVLVASLAILIASYHLFVRFTFIGQLLNGRKYSRRGADQAEKDVSATESKGSVA
jgi:peptidoglycan/LPS O-acetylase OafA/YrhL